MAKAKASASSDTAAIVAKTIEELTRKYFDKLRKVQSDTQKRIETAVRKLIRVPQDLQEAGRNQSVDLLTNYIEALKTASTDPEAVKLVEEALHDYVAGLQSLQIDIQRDIENALRDYTRTLEELPFSVRNNIQAAYAEYLAQMKDMMTEADPESMDPDILAALGQSILTVALYTRAALAK